MPKLTDEQKAERAAKRKMTNALKEEARAHRDEAKRREWRERGMYLAYLTLPDVNATADNLLESFNEMFAGTYPDYEAALIALSPLED